VEQLKRLKIDSDTIIMFSSDNGPHREGQNDPDFFNSNGRLRGIKRDLYEGGIRVPLIVRWPGRIKPGQKSGHISAFWDFLPTACDLAGLKKPADSDGISFVPALLGNTQTQHDYLYWEFVEQGGKQAIRRDNWKAVRLNVHDNPEEPLELYNLENDPEENDNIAGRHPDTIKELENLMENARFPSKIFPFRFETQHPK
jgi:arylsulfatase A-like enzyme